MPYIATVNVPGYMPMDDDPPTFDTAREAWQYLEDEYVMSWNDVDVPGDSDDMLPEPYFSQYRETCELFTTRWNHDVVGTVYAPTPGYEGEHDLGLAYSVTPL